MKTLVIYDDTGIIFNQVTGNYLVPQGSIQFLETEVPEGKQITSVDVSVTSHQVILEDEPPTEVDIMKKQLADLQYELMMNGVL